MRIAIIMSLISAHAIYLRLLLLRVLTCVLVLIQGVPCDAQQLDAKLLATANDPSQSDVRSLFSTSMVSERTVSKSVKDERDPATYINALVGGLNWTVVGVGSYYMNQGQVRFEEQVGSGGQIGYLRIPTDRPVGLGWGGMVTVMHSSGDMTLTDYDGMFGGGAVRVSFEGKQEIFLTQLEFPVFASFRMSRSLCAQLGVSPALSLSKAHSEKGMYTVSTYNGTDSTVVSSPVEEVSGVPELSGALFNVGGGFLYQLPAGFMADLRGKWALNAMDGGDGKVSRHPLMIQMSFGVDLTVFKGSK